MKNFTLFAVLPIIAMILYFGINTKSLAGEQCSAQSQDLHCAQIEIKDSGCSITCQSENEEPSCHVSQCNALSKDHKEDFICSEIGSNCLSGNDGRKYLYTKSSCFCD